jgi:hypothetical protein
MKEFKATATINAPADKVWSILVDTGKWPEWDPFCDRIEGSVALGSKVTAFSKLSPGRGFPVKVVELDEPRQMIWQGGMPLGLFKGVRTFTLDPKGDGVKFTLHEQFTGLMSGLIPLPDMTEAFEKFVQGLKKRAEAN